jgi:hypothetical protein
MHRYRLFGRVLETEQSFGHRLIQCEGVPDFRFRVETDLRCPAETCGRSIFVSSAKADTAPWLEAFATESGHLLRFAGLGSFDIGSTAISWYPVSGSISSPEAETAWERPTEMEILFLGNVLALWLEQRGALCLHGSAVQTGFDGVAFLGFNRAGKTTLATEFLATGEELITDDLLVVERSITGTFVAQPSYPQIRLWPVGVAHFVGAGADPPKIHPRLDKRRIEITPSGLGSLALAATPLRALVLPQRSDDTEGIALTRLFPREATIELVRHSFLGALGEAVIGVDRRFDRLVAIAARVPVFRLVYPNGLEHLPRVREAILKQLSAL